MSHIPEDELHAYLDQALGRWRCVEIESHLAECTRCRDARDGIAALRDRTTALLARLAPRRTTIPPYADIRRQAQLRLFRHERILARLAWAASMVLALGIGWTASTLYRAPSETLTPLAAAPEPVSLPAAGAETPDAAVGEPAPPAAQPASTPAAGRSAPEHRLAAVPAVSRPVPGQSAPDAWRTVEWDAAPGRPAESGPVNAAVSPQPPAASNGSVVSRQLAAGEVMRSVGGSATDMSSFLSGRPAPGPEVKPAAPAMPPAYTSGTLALRQGGVAVSPSAVPSDSLRAIMRRLNLMSRVR